jgi:His/Glu/Gln/Arg/opine family amino acid ABC transporter permease subunit
MISDLAGFFATYEENWASWWPQLLPAIWVTIKLTVASFLLALVIGFLLALGKLSRNRVIRAFATGYVELARGIPALAVLFILYFGLLPVGIVLDAFVAGVIGLGMSGGGYFAEVFRAGILAVHKGQREAAASTGMTPFTSFRWIILPQAMRVILPPMMNLFISLLKDTSLCSLITAPELMLRAKDLAMMSFLPMHLFVLAGAVYFLLAWPMSLLARHFEKRMRRGYRAG